MNQRHFSCAHSTSARYAWSAQRILGRLTWLRNASKANRPPSRSCTSAGVITSAHKSPSVSTTTCRLRPATFFSRIVAAWPALLGGLHTLAVEDRSRRFGLFARLASHPLAQHPVNPLPRAVALPQAKVMKHNPIRWEVVWQTPPRAAIARDIQNCVDDLAARVLGRTTARLRFGNPRRDSSPLAIPQVGRVRVPSHNA